MELFWTPEATQDRDEIYNYIEADNPAAALALDELFAEKAGRLVDHPGLGQAGAPAAHAPPPLLWRAGTELTLEACRHGAGA
ncbi:MULTISPECIES: type II toxin-antitoxin system RelE/ParE family toxin [Serpentinimonas]|nr:MULTISPECIES: type II toxin-antitoxin system RelE/ParE family toxin [Serpentinimonas]